MMFPFQYHECMERKDAIDLKLKVSITECDSTLIATHSSSVSIVVISGFVMDQNGKALAHGIFATWSFRGDGIQQLTNNMILLLPLVQFKRSLYHPKGIDPKKDQIYLDANVAFTMFDAAVLKVMFLSLC